jgi:HEAT repeat protein
MIRLHILAILASLAIASPADASPRMLPQPPPKPLGVVVGDSKTIHVLRVASVGPDGVAFKVEASLKGEIKVPFSFATVLGNAGCEGLFREDELVLCFRRGEVAVLHVSGRWALAVEPIAWRGEKDWFCMTEEGYAVTYDGPTKELREHVAAILEGREAIVTARTPALQGMASGRVWRIKAGAGVTDFALSDESPQFVGWGTGDPKEVTKLTRALRSETLRERIAAASDLAHLGAAALPAIPTLRRALRDPEAAAAFAAAKALAQLEPDDDEGIEALRSRLGDGDAKVCCAAAEALGDLGSRASEALPELLRAVRDRHEAVRDAAAEAIGRIAAASPPPKAVAALAGLLKEDQEGIRHSAVRSLRRFGPYCWSAMPALRASLAPSKDESGRSYFRSEAVALLARFNPPPVEVLAELLEDERYGYDTRKAAARQLGALGSYSQPTCRALAGVLRGPQEGGDEELNALRLEAAEALLVIDPEGGPALAGPALLELAKNRSSEAYRATRLLGRCGSAARPSLPTLLKALERDDFLTPFAVQYLTPLIGPEDQDLLPALRQLLSGKHGDSLALADVLLRLDRREEALAQAMRCLDGDRSYRTAAAARWLAERGREAKVAEAALRKALSQATGMERSRLALTLVRLCDGEGSGPRARALTALGNLLSVCEGKAPAIGCMEQRALWLWQASYAARQEDDDVGAAVGTVYSRLEAGRETIAVLRKALGDRDPHMRLTAAVALAAAEPQQRDAVAELRRLLETHPHYFVYAADTLVALGPTAAPVSPHVLALCRHPDDDVCRAACRVLRRIDPVLAAKATGAAGVPGAVPEDLGPLWEGLASKDPLQADLAVWRLAGAGSRAAVLVRDRLRLPPAPSSERVTVLIADLDSNDFDTRERASTELAEAIETAGPALRKKLAEGTSPEQRRRLEALLTDPAPTPEQRRQLRAVRVLEATGVAESRVLLKSLAKGDERLALTRAAAAALGRLE